MSNRLVPFDLDHMHLVIETLAKVHAISWVYRNHVESQITEKFPCLVTNLRMENMEIWSSVINANLEQAKEIFDKEFGPGNNYSASADKFAGMVGKISELTCGGDEDGTGIEKLLRITNPDPVKFGRDAKNPGKCHAEIEEGFVSGCIHDKVLFGLYLASFRKFAEMIKYVNKRIRKV